MKLNKLVVRPRKMDVSKYEKTIIVHCPVCANTEFKVDTEESGQFACNDCNAEFSREELMTEHSEHISRK